MQTKKPAAKTRRKGHTCPNVIIHVKATYNNTIVTATDPTGATLCWASAPNVGFKGSKKSTPYAAGMAVAKVMEELRPYSVQEVEIRIKGVGAGRESAVRAVAASSVQITTIKDLTPLAHNGCRQKKQRRV